MLIAELSIHIIPKSQIGTLFPKLMSNFDNTYPIPLSLELATSGLLDSPFCLYDVGAWSGVHRRWRALGQHLAGVGFDLDPDEMQRLAERDKDLTPNFEYRFGAVSNYNGNTTFDVREHARDNSLVTGAGNCKVIGQREVPVVTLDTFVLGEGRATPDFIKLDTEGSELDILDGAKELLAAGTLVGGEFESAFGAPHEARRPFFELYQVMSEYGFEIFDLQTGRLPRPQLPHGRLSQDTRGYVCSEPLGQVCHLDVLLMRNLPATDPKCELPVSSALKQIMAFEVYGLNDCAAEVLEHYSGVLESKLDIARARDLLVPHLSGSPLTHEAYMKIGELLSQDHLIRPEFNTALSNIVVER